MLPCTGVEVQPKNGLMPMCLAVSKLPKFTELFTGNVFALLQSEGASAV